MVQQKHLIDTLLFGNINSLVPGNQVEENFGARGSNQVEYCSVVQLVEAVVEYEIEVGSVVVNL